MRRAVQTPFHGSNSTARTAGRSLTASTFPEIKSKKFCVELMFNMTLEVLKKPLAADWDPPAVVISCRAKGESNNNNAAAAAAGTHEHE